MTTGWEESERVDQATADDPEELTIVRLFGFMQETPGAQLLVEFDGTRFPVVYAYRDTEDEAVVMHLGAGLPQQNRRDD